MEKIMARRTEEEKAKDLVAEMVTPRVEEVDIEDMPLNTLGDYLRYNKKAREINKKLRLCRHKIKQCPIELHPKERITIMRNDKNSSKIPVLLSNEMIHFEQMLEQGKEYELPRCVVEHLANRGTPVWRWFNLGDGAKETRISHYDPRFSIRTIYR